MNNPLLQAHSLPPFDSIKAEHVLPAIESITRNNLEQLQQQLAEVKTPSWGTIVAAQESRDDILNQSWSPISHLNSVANNDELRTAYQQAQAVLSNYYTELGQNQDLFQAYDLIFHSDDFQRLSQAQRQVIINGLRDFKLSGVNLEGEAKDRYQQIRSRLTELQTSFSNNVLDATHAWSKLITDEDLLSGLPPSSINAASHAAEEKGEEGWLLTLDGPVYLTVMSQADNRELRREFYAAFSTRASDQGPGEGQFDNSELMTEILQLRTEMAKLLGFESYADYSIASKMAESSDQVLGFLVGLAEKARPAALVELEELKAWTKETFQVEDLQAWDIPYYSEKLKQAKYGVSQEELRPYFTLPKVLRGLFALVSRLFQVEISAKEGEQTWHKDVSYFVIKRDGKEIASFYLDLYARAKKRGGAWMADCRARRQTDSGLQLPVAFMVCNFNQPIAGTPALLTHMEVTTLFHEFGHGLHHMLTQVEVAGVSGINGVEWDAVELPSQFMENWCWQREVLKGLSCHVDSGESLPDQMIEKMLEAKNFQSALFMVRQLEFALFDFSLHLNYGRDDFVGIQALLDEVRSQVAVFSPPAFNRFQHSFTHIFAGGYAAGYYSYKWAEVLSADAFAAFEEAQNDEQMGQRFLQNILEKGGSEPAMSLFRQFRGREPNVDALLRHTGIARD